VDPNTDCYGQVLLGSANGIDYFADVDHVYRKNGHGLKQISVNKLPYSIRSVLMFFWASNDNSGSCGEGYSSR
jgi:hypothetical protein